MEFRGIDDNNTSDERNKKLTKNTIICLVNILLGVLIGTLIVGVFFVWKKVMNEKKEIYEAGISTFKENNNIHFFYEKINDDMFYSKLSNGIEIIKVINNHNKEFDDNKGYLGLIYKKKDEIGVDIIINEAIMRGSKKYPKESFFQNFLSQHNGTLTIKSDIGMNFFVYDINEDVFLESIDIFLNMVFWPNLNNIPINEEEIVQLPSEYSLLLEVNNQPIVKKHELINEVKPSLLLEQLRVVVVSGKKDYMIDDLLIYNLMKIKQNKKDSRKSPLISTLIYSQIGKIIFERNSAQKQGKIVIWFNLPYQIDYASSLVLSQLFSSSDFKNNLKDILIKHQLISDFQILYETNQIMKLSFSTTNKGMHNSNIIIAIISKYIGQLSSMDYKNVNINLFPHQIQNLLFSFKDFKLQSNDINDNFTFNKNEIISIINKISFKNAVIEIQGNNATSSKLYKIINKEKLIEIISDNYVLSSFPFKHIETQENLFNLPLFQ